MANIPQVIVTIDAEGQLVVKLPGLNGFMHSVVLNAADAGQTLTRILSDQCLRLAQIGDDGAPTQAQVRHWEQHSSTSNAKCAFCQAEGLGASRQNQKQWELLCRNGDTEVRVIKFRDNLRKAVVAESPEALGL